MRIYELNCLISAKLDEAEKNTVIQTIENLITQKGGKITKTNPPVEVILAYPVRKEQRAQFVLFVFEYENDLTDLKAGIEKDKRVLRVLFKQVPVKRKIPLPRKRGKVKQEKKVELEDVDKKIEEIFNPAHRAEKPSDQSEVNLKEDEFK